MSSNFLPTSHHSSKNKITLIHPPQTQPYWWSIKRPRYSILIRLSWLIMRPNRCWSPMDFDHKLVAIAHTTIPPFIQTQDRSSKHKTTVPPPQLWGAYNIFSHGNTWKLGYKVPISSSSTYTAPINTIWTHQYYLDICVHRGVSWYKTPPTNTIGTAAHSFLMFLRSFITCSSKRIQICLLHVWHM